MEYLYSLSNLCPSYSVPKKNGQKENIHIANLQKENPAMRTKSILLFNTFFKHEEQCAAKQQKHWAECARVCVYWTLEQCSTMEI